MSLHTPLFELLDEVFWAPSNKYSYILFVYNSWGINVCQEYFVSQIFYLDMRNLLGRANRVSVQ